MPGNFHLIFVAQIYFSPDNFDKLSWLMRIIYFIEILRPTPFQIVLRGILIWIKKLFIFR